jgi:hypothetical protein
MKPLFIRHSGSTQSHPESRCYDSIVHWIPARAGMTGNELIRGYL